MPLPAITDFLYPLQWNLKVMQVEGAWLLLQGVDPDITFGNPDIVTAVVDTGIHSVTRNGITVPVHEDFNVKVGVNPNQKDKVAAFYDIERVLNNNDFPSGDHGGGVAGIIAAAINGKGTVGIAPNTRLIGIIKGSTATSTSKSDTPIPEIILWAAGFTANLSTPPANLSPGDTASVINYSLEFKGQVDYNAASPSDKPSVLASMQEARDAIDKITAIGRDGLGVIMVAAAGNGTHSDGIPVQISNISAIAAYKKTLTVGASKITGIYPSVTETTSYYTNFGPELDVLAPAGEPTMPPPSTNYIPPSSYTVFSTSNWNGGDTPGETDFQLTLQNNVNSGSGEKVLRVSDITGLFPGQSICIGTPSSTNINLDFRIIKRIEVDTNTPPNKLIIKGLAFNHNTGEKITIATLLTKLTANFTSGSDFFVENTMGFFVGQNIIIGNPAGTFEKTTIGAIDNNTLKISIIPQRPVANTYNTGTILIADTPPKTTLNAIASPGTGPFQLVSSYGFYSGQSILIDSERVLVDTVNYTNHQITLKSTTAITGTYTATTVVQASEIILKKTAGGNAVFVDDASGFENGQRISFELPGDVDYEELINIWEKFPPSLGQGWRLNEKLDNTHTNNSSIIRKRYGGWTYNFSGTSAATPMVSGIVTLILSAKPKLNWLEVIDFIRTTADKIGSMSYTPSGPYGRNDYFGYGRINASNAVAAAISYTYDKRDLMIRDDGTDTGLAAITGAVDSPDVWVRNLPDPSYTSPGGYGTPGPHQNPVANSQKKIYVRVKNIGTSLPSLEGAEVRCFVAYISDPNNFVFPKSFIETSNDPNGENVFLVGKKDLTAVPAGSDQTFDFAWDNTKVLLNPNNLPAYLLVHVTPFDRGETGTTIKSNNNLTYKQLVFSDVKYKSGSGTGSLQNVIPVDTNGTQETLPFEIVLENTNLPFANNIEIKATINYRNTTPSETVTFKYNGSTYAFASPPTGGWITLGQPVLSGSNVNNTQEFTTFNGSLTADNTVLDITLETLQKDGSSNVVLDVSSNLDVTFNFPVPPGGVAEEKKTAIYTFTDFDQLPAQSTITNAKVYGPVSGNLTTKYRTWAAFTGIASGSVLKAYAATNGEFFIQEVPSSNVVNLVLKPDNQPDNKIGLVKYFVYRGLKKSSFLQPSGEPLANGSGLSDVMARMWAVRTSLDTESSIPDVIHRSDLGLDETGTMTPTPGTTLIEDHFDTYVFQKLSAGWYIGDFDTTTDYGFEIIVEGPEYRPILDDLKVLDHVIEITYQSGQPQFANNVEEDIKTKLDRETILSFVDPSAYFGLLAFGKIELKKSSGNITITNNAAQVKTEIIDKFGATANSFNIYIDVRNEFNNSLNYYGSYSDTTLATKVAVLKFNDTSNSFINKQYHTSGWPILTLTNADFNAGTGDFISAKFELPQGDNSYPVLFLIGASFFADGLNYKDKFKALNTSSFYSDAFEISIANLSSPATVLPFIIKLQYARRYDLDNLPPIPSILTWPWKDDHLDTVLALNDVNVTPPPNDSTFQTSAKWNTNSELRYVGWTSLKGFDLTLRSGMAKESIGTTFFAFSYGPTEINEKTSYSDGHSNLVLEKGSSILNSIFYALKEKNVLSFEYYEIPISSINIKSIKVDSKNDNISIDILNKSGDDLLSLSLDNTEFNTLLSTSASNFLSNAKVYIVPFNHQLNADDQNYPYYTFEIGLCGINQSNNNLSRVNTNIKVYSFNGKNYFTESYSTALKNLIDTNANDYNS